MAATFTVQLIGDKAVIGRLGSLPAKLHAELVRTVTRLAMLLQAKVQQTKLQGQVLRHVTGSLSASINNAVTDEPNSVLGRVFSNGTVKYAAIHEFGFHGSENVAAHDRKMTMVFGRPIDPIIAHVGAFTRQMNMPERSFLRSTLVENASMIEKALTDCVARAWGAE